ncbi:hypothetical protein BJ912DRAFT_989193 [Pholiota molesta]|nr:hypothetical protein BJ912DRAFT_989193 [Pholiota molesta]
MIFREDALIWAFVGPLPCVLQHVGPGPALRMITLLNVFLTCGIGITVMEIG